MHYVKLFPISFQKRSEIAVSHLLTYLRKLRREEDGTTAVEYAVMLSLIAVVVLVGVGELAGKMSDNYNQTGKSIADAMNN